MIIDKRNLENELVKILEGVLDVEEVESNKILIIKKKEKIILNNVSERIKKLCYERLGENIFGKKKKSLKRVLWKDDDIKYLKNNKMDNISELSKKLGKSKYQVNYMMSELNLFEKKSWSKEDIEFLEKNIDLPLIWVSEKLNRSLASVKSKRRILRNKIELCE